MILLETEVGGSLLASMVPWRSFKVIVRPIITILSLFIPLQVVPNLYEYLSSAEHKRRYFEDCWWQSGFWSPFTSIVFFFPILWNSVGTSTCLVTHICQNLFSHKFRTIWGWVNGNFHFWVNYSFKGPFTQMTITLTIMIKTLNLIE